MRHFLTQRRGNVVTTVVFMGKKHKAIGWYPMRSLLQDAGASVASKDSVDEVITILENFAVTITHKALEFMTHAKRKKLNKEDVQLAVKTLFPQ